MKKVALVAVLGIVAMAIAGIIVLRSIAAKGESSSSAAAEVSPRTAEGLQAKIDAVKKAHETPDRQDSSSVELSEAELESYVLYSLKEDIPLQLDSIDVQLASGTIASDTQLTFTSNGAGNPLVDSLFGGTHNLFIKGKLAGQASRGKFDLEEIRVDGIPVPNILIQTLFDKYVKPKYPDVDLRAPFELPWGIEQLTLESGKATVVY